MASIVKIKRSSVQGKAPTASDIQAGELALNTRDGKLFSSDGSAVFEIGANLHSLSVGTGGLVIGNGAITFPTEDGTIGQILTTNGSGQLVFANPAAGGDSLGYTNSTITSDTLFSTDEVDFEVLSAGVTQDAFGVFLDGEVSDWMEPIREMKTHDLGVLA